MHKAKSLHFLELTHEKSLLFIDPHIQKVALRISGLLLTRLRREETDKGLEHLKEKQRESVGKDGYSIQVLTFRAFSQLDL